MVGATAGLAVSRGFVREMGGLNLEYLGASRLEGTPNARCPKSSKSDLLCSPRPPCLLRILRILRVLPHMPVSRRPSWVDNRKAYASLPSSPVAPSTPLEESQPAAEIPFSLWDYLREEILATDFDSHQEIKWERVSNFLQVPFAIEKVRPMVLLIRIPLTPNQIISFGLLLCLDSFLYTFTIMPLRAVLSLYRLLMNMARPR